MKAISMPLLSDSKGRPSVTVTMASAIIIVALALTVAGFVYGEDFDPSGMLSVAGAWLLGRDVNLSVNRRGTDD